MATSLSMADSIYSIEEARLSDLDSLSTILARSFHPVNPFIKATLPDTPLVREWWQATFRQSLADSNARVLIAVDTTSKVEPRKVLGVLTLRLMGPDETGAGLWEFVPPSPDHHKENFAGIMYAMSARENIMCTGQAGAQSHFLIELFGVDHESQGKGLGGMLLRRACEVADEAGYETFVQANKYAREMYCNVGGFVVKEHQVLNGGYEEYMLVRAAKQVVF